jgi:hypothetical protein
MGGNILPICACEMAIPGRSRQTHPRTAAASKTHVFCGFCRAMTSAGAGFLHRFCTFLRTAAWRRRYRFSPGPAATSAGRRWRLGSEGRERSDRRRLRRARRGNPSRYRRIWGRRSGRLRLAVRPQLGGRYRGLRRLGRHRGQQRRSRHDGERVDGRHRVIVAEHDRRDRDPSGQDEFSFRRELPG